MLVFNMVQNYMTGIYHWIISFFFMFCFILAFHKGLYKTTSQGTAASIDAINTHLFSMFIDTWMRMFSSHRIQ